jgi:hypothetical protein
MTSVAAKTASWRLTKWGRGPGLVTTPGGNDPDGGLGDAIGLKVEIFVNSAWTDISPFVYYKNRVKITRGKPNETSQIQPQTCTFTINNRDGRFSPRNPLGPYYGQIGRNTPIRVSRLQNGIRRFRFHGEIPTWPTTYDISGTDVHATVTAAGQMRRLFQGNQPLHSAFYRAYALGFSSALTPIAYWPCEDGQNAGSIASGLAGGSAMVLSGQALPTFASNSSFPCSTPLPLLSASVWTGGIPAYSGGTANILRFLMFIPATGGYDTGVLARMYTAGTVARLDMRYGAASNGSLNLTGYDAAGTQLFTTGYVAVSIGGYSGGFNNLPLMVSMELAASGGTVSASLNYMPLVAVAGSFGTSFTLGSGGSTAGSLGNATQAVISPDGNFNDTAIGHVVYQSAVDTLGDVSYQFNANITEAASTRFTRLCTEQGVSGIASGAYELTAMGYQLNDTFLNLVQQPAASGAALIYESRDQAALALRGRTSLYNQTAKLTLDHSAHQLSGPLNPVDDDALTRNDVMVQRINGSSYQSVQASGTLSTQPPPNGVGEYATSVSLSLDDDSVLADHAGWRLHLGTVDQSRYPQISINLRHSTFTSSVDMMNAALTIEIGDRLVVTNPPAWMPPDPISQIVQGYTETLGIFEHDIVFNCSPEDPYEVGVLDDVVLGRADTDGSTLALAAGEADSTLSVTTTGAATGSPLWAMDVAEFPFDVNIGGERITLTSYVPVAVGSADGTFETGAGGWSGTNLTISATSADHYQGSQCGLATLTSTSGFLFPTSDPTVVAGATYYVSAAFKRASGSPSVQVYMQWLTAGATSAGATLVVATQAAGASWTTASMIVTAPSAAATVEPTFLVIGAATNAIYVDYVFVQPVSSPQKFATTRSVNGVVKAQTAGTDIRLWQPMIVSL